MIEPQNYCQHGIFFKAYCADCVVNRLTERCDALAKELERTGLERNEIEQRLAQEKKHVETLCQDWADDDTRIKELAKPFGIDVEGDSYSVPSILDIADAMVLKINSLLALVEQKNAALESLKTRALLSGGGYLGTTEIVEIADQAPSLTAPAALAAHDAAVRAPLVEALSEMVEAFSTSTCNCYAEPEGTDCDYCKARYGAFSTARAALAQHQGAKS